MLDDKLLAELKRFDQLHLIAFWDKLNPAQQKSLKAQLRSIDFTQLNRLKEGNDESPDWASLAARAEPPPAIRSTHAPGSFQLNDLQAKAKAIGEKSLRAGKIAMILVAGGQGTRLGFDLPKGMFRIGPLSNRSLFEFHVDRLRAVMKEYHVSIPLYIMTSPATDVRTRLFFSENDSFGLGSDQLRIFCQGTMPAVDIKTGKILLSNPGDIALSPDGHGGLLQAMSIHGCLDDAADLGIEHFFYGQVDNPLVEICDPILIGHHIQANSEMTTQVVRKQTPVDRVGNVVSIDGRVQIIEYSDLPESAGKQLNPDGSLKLWAGNIAVHLFKHRFLDRVQHSVQGLPFHRAHKSVATIDEKGESVEPKQPNATKFERFIFDLLPLAEKALVVEADAARVFAPVKNAEGAANETPSLTKRAISNLHRSWLEAAGATLETSTVIEIHPNWALNAEAVAKKIIPGLHVAAETYFR
ncbi:MAG: UDPGP type 1 family protein [Pirellulaceae bacterium]|nr:UDPGP type 1 family protein [Pirellulaceae bacterium]